MAVSVAFKVGAVLTSALSSYNTSSQTPAAGTAPLLVITNYNNAGGNAQTPTVTGAGYTWANEGTERVRPGGGNEARVTVFSGTGTPSTGALTIAFAGVTQGAISYDWFEVSGGSLADVVVQAKTGNNGGVTPSTTDPITYTSGFASGSGAFVAYAFYLFPSGVTRTCTPRSGWTELRDYTDANLGGVNVQWRATSDTIADTTVSITDFIGGVALELKIAALSQTVSQANEEDLSQAVGKTKKKAVGQPSEQDQAQTISAGMVHPVSQASEQDLAQTVAHSKRKVVGQPSENDAAQAVTGGETVPVLQASEQDLAQAIGKTKRKAVGQTNEEDLAQVVLAFPVFAAAHVLDFDVDGTGGTSITTPAIVSRVSGSSFLASSGRLQLSSHVPPTDSKGNAYTQVGTSHAYTLWPTSGTASYVSLNATGGSGHTFSAAKPNNHEITIAVVEVANGLVVQDQKWNEVLSGSPTTSLDVVTTGPACLVSFWWGDGNLGTTHVANPSAGWTKIDGVSIDTVLVQCAVAYRNVVAPGTYNVTWTPQSPSTEGAQVWIFALQESSELVQSVGQVQEEDSAQAVGKVKRKAVVQSNENDATQPVARVKTKAVAQSNENDATQAISRSKSRLVVQALANELAQVVLHSKLRALAQTFENDTTQIITRIKARALGQSSEQDLAQDVLRIGAGAVISQATEQDVAQVVARSKVKALSQTHEIDTAQTVIRALLSIVNPASETDLAQILGHFKRKAIGGAFEADRAFAISGGAVVVPLEDDFGAAVSFLEGQLVADVIIEQE